MFVPAKKLLIVLSNVNKKINDIIVVDAPQQNKWNSTKKLKWF